MVRMPNGSLEWKATLIASLQRPFDSSRRSADRLVRVQQRLSELPQGASAPAADDADAPEQLGVRDDFAIAFHLTDARGERYEWWLGRVLALFRKSAGKSFVQINSVSLSQLLDGITVVASWYEPTDASRAVYRLGSVNDTRKYPLGGAYLGCPRLDYDAEARVCKLVDAPRQIRALDDSLAATKPLREGSARSGRPPASSAQWRPRRQRRLLRAIAQHRLPSATPRGPSSS